MCAPHFVYLFIVDECLGCFYLLATVDAAAMNMGVQILFLNMLNI